MVLTGWLVLFVQHARDRFQMRWPVWCTEVTLASRLREPMDFHRILGDQSAGIQVLTSHGEHPTAMLLPLSSVRSGC